MSIQRFFTKTFTIKRQVWSGSSSDESTIGTFKGHKQQTPAQEIATLGIAYGKACQVWCPVGTDVKVGDVIDDGNRYSVRAVNTRDYGINQHLQLTIEGDEV